MVPTLIIFFITSVISVLMAEPPIFAVISLSYSLTVAKTVETNFRTLFVIFLIVILLQCCYTACAEATSFLRSSYGHLQVQTVPSSARDAPCPVVTPSLKGLGSAFSVFYIFYFLFYSFDFERTDCKILLQISAHCFSLKFASDT